MDSHLHQKRNGNFDFFKEDIRKEGRSKESSRRERKDHKKTKRPMRHTLLHQGRIAHPGAVGVRHVSRKGKGWINIGKGGTLSRKEKEKGASSMDIGRV